MPEECGDTSPRPCPRSHPHGTGAGRAQKGACEEAWPAQPHPCPSTAEPLGASGASGAAWTAEEPPPPKFEIRKTQRL